MSTTEPILTDNFITTVPVQLFHFIQIIVQIIYDKNSGIGNNENQMKFKYILGYFQEQRIYK